MSERKTDDGLYWTRAFAAVEMPDGSLIMGGPISGTGISPNPPADERYAHMRDILESEMIEPERRLKPGQPFYHVTGRIKLVAGDPT